MADEQHRPRLGRGLAALIADSASQMPEAFESRDRKRNRDGPSSPEPAQPPAPLRRGGPR